MANTTNFGWETPDDTDLVKDGASAMRTLGNAIDTSLVDLKGGTTGQVLSKASNTDMDFTWSSVDPLTILDAKGDLISATAADSPARLPVGTNGQLLTADSTTSTGLKWADAPSSGAYTQLATGTLSGTAVTLSSISQSYVDLYLTINNPVVNTGTALAYRINGVTSATYGARGIATDSTTVVGTSTQTILYANQGSNLPTSASNESAILYIRDYTKNARKTMECSYAAGANAFTNYQVGYAATTSAITTIEIRTVNGTSTFSGGTYTLYGVK